MNAHEIICPRDYISFGGQDAHEMFLEYTHENNIIFHGHRNAHEKHRPRLPIRPNKIMNALAIYTFINLEFKF